MKKAFLVLFAGSCALLAACSTPAPIYVAPTVQPKVEATSPQRAVSQVDADFIAVDEVNLKLRVRMQDTGSESAFSKKLIQRLSSNLTAVAEFVSDGAGDVKIVFTPEFELKDADGEFCRVRCVQVETAIFYQNRQIAARVVSPAELPRKVGEQNAKDQYLAPVAAKIAPFLQKELLQLSGTELAVSEINFALKNTQKSSTSVNVAEQVNKIKQVFDSMEGVVSYAISNQDVKNATCSFRVVYQKRMFPQGIANALNLKLANK